MLPRLRQRPVLVRLAVVWLTAIAVVVLACCWGPPFPYRLNETYPHDLRVRTDFEVVNPVALANSERADARQTNDGPVIEKYPAGMLLIPRGQPIAHRQLDLLREEHAAFLRQQSTAERVQRAVSMLLLFTLFSGLVALYVARFQTALARSLPTILGLCGLVLLTIALGAWLSRPPWHAIYLPLTLTAMILTLVYNPQFALLMSFSLSLAMSVLLGADLKLPASANGRPGHGGDAAAQRPHAHATCQSGGRRRRGLFRDDAGHRLVIGPNLEIDAG